jgi:tryptophan-rich sensory protein
MRIWTALAFTGLAAGAAALIGNLSAEPRDMRRYYRRLDKPSFAPPAKVFGPVWGVLYPAIALSGARVLAAPASPARSAAIALWLSQMALNAAWTPLFFGRKDARAALADIAGVLALTAAYTVAASRVDRPAAALALPYVGWVTFAGALNRGIVERNPRA